MPLRRFGHQVRGYLLQLFHGGEEFFEGFFRDLIGYLGDMPHPLLTP